MKKGKMKNKFTLIFSMAMTLAAIFVCSVSTIAWFELSSQPLQTSLITGSGGVELVDDSVYGYKITPTLGGDGKINYDNTTVTKKNGSTITTTNTSLDGADTNFDVPDQGIGYYLIEQNAENTFTYKYNNVVMATKFTSKTGGTVNSHFIETKALSAKNYRVKQYTFVDNQTVYDQVPINSTGSSEITLNNTGANPTYDVTVNTAGTYKIWLIYSAAKGTWDLSLESAAAYDPAAQNISSNQSGNRSLGISRGTTASSKSNVTQSGFSSYTIKVTFSHGYRYWWVWSDGNSGNYGGNYQIWHGNAAFENSSVSSGAFNASTIYLKVQYQDNEDVARPDNKEKQWDINTTKWGTSFTAGSTNYIELTDWNTTPKAQTKSVLTIKYVNSSGTTIRSDDSVVCWNHDSIASSNDWSTKGSPSINGYTFSDWYTTATGSTKATTSGYIEKNATIYARYTENSPSTTKYTTYLYDAKGTYASPTWSSPKAYVWGTDGYLINDSATIAPTASYEHEGHKYWKFDISVTYSKLLFNNNGTMGSLNQTVNLEQSDASGKYYCLTSDTVSEGGYTKYQGEWCSSKADMADTFTTYVYDATNTWTTLSSVKAHCWVSGIAPTQVEITAEQQLTHTYYAGSTTPVTHKYYKFSIPKVYSNFNFYYGTNSGSNQTVDLTKAAGTSKYYVIDGTLSGGKKTGYWYSNLVSSSTFTYYYYDNSSPRKLGDTPVAYAWASSGATSGGGDNHTIYPFHNAAWGSEVAMTHYSDWTTAEKNAFDTAHPNVDNANVWRTVVSQSYDKIIFHKAGSGTANDDQTIDLTTTDHNGYFFVLTGGGTSAGKWDGSWAEDVYGITLKASFFIKNSSGTTKSTIASQNIGTDYTFGIEPFVAKSYSFNDYEYSDRINGILYLFEDVNSGDATWYTDEACLTPYTSTAVATNFTLYRKFVADFTGDDYQTFYIDASNSGSGTSDRYWQNISVCGEGLSDTPYFSSNDSGANWKVGTHLYRVTLPKSYSVRIANSGYSSVGGNNTTSTFSVSSVVTSDYLMINSNAWGNCSVSACTNFGTNIGSATIYVKAPNSANFQDMGTMSIGDLTSNDFVYELGIQIESGSLVYIDRLDTDGETHHYYKYKQFVDPIPSYIGEATTDGNPSNSHNIIMQNYTGNARFNFYVTHSGELSIVMVPDDGNGYYIMPYNSSFGTSTYSGAIKMSSGSKINASYDGYYANSNEQIFIRSYIDAVDTLYKAGSSDVPQTGASTNCIILCGSVSTHTDVQLNTQTGIITFGSAAIGYYDIDVYNGVVTVSPYNVGDFFKLNPIIDTTTSVATATAIKNQKTTLVLEVQFTCNNSYDSKISLTADNPMADFVGATLYCSSTQLSDPYNYLRNNYYNISSTNGVINDSNTSFTIQAGSSSTYYAYIMIDYLSIANGGVYTNYMSQYAGNMYFYLNATQYIAPQA